jgi:hypothetical protein
MRDFSNQPLTDQELREFDALVNNDNHSKSVRILDRKSIADSAHRNFGSAVLKLERLERDCAAAFVELEKRAAEVQELGTRAEPVWERMPLLSAAHDVWQASKVGPAPLPPLVSG